MANASFMQTSFLGGKWSLSAQGRISDPRYKTALSICMNGLPKLSGQWTRRPGFREMAHTRSGSPAALQNFHYRAIEPYQVELTDGFLRLYASMGLIFTADKPTITSISNATPAVVTMPAVPATWLAGDTVMFKFNAAPWGNYAGALSGRQFVIQNVTGTTFELWDSLTGLGVDGTTFTYAVPAFGTPDAVLKVLEFATPYNFSSWLKVKLVQNSDTALLLHNSFQPRALTQAFGTFAFAAQGFTDGPYLDINTTTTTLTPSGASGSITLTASAATGINGGQGFVQTDVGRLVRFQSGPAAWAGGTTYATGQQVTGSDANIYTSAVGGNVGHDPTTDTGAFWTLAGTSVTWSWLTITAWTSATVVTATVSGVNLPSLAAQTAWRMGLYSDTTGWPSCGTYHEGRFWFGGVVENRFDASAAGTNKFNFAPTATDGTVGDANAIAATLDAPNVNQILWFVPDEEGIIVGTAEAEWLISASATNDPLTPSTIQAHRVSTYGSANIEPQSLTRTLAFVQSQKQQIYSYAHAPYGDSSSWNGDQVGLDAEDLMTIGVEEIRWVQTPFYCLWARLTDGSLAGTLFEPDDRVPTNAWHTHTHGGGHKFIDISSGPTYDGLSQTLYAITQDPATGYCYAEAMERMFQEGTPGWQANFTDGVTPLTQADLKLISNGDSFNGLRMYGMADAIGKTVTPVINGYDVGTFTVLSPGQIDIPFDSVFTQASLATFTDPSKYGPYGLPTSRPTCADSTAALIEYPVRTAVTTGWTLGAWRMTIEDYARNFMYLISSLGVSRCNLATGDLIDQFTFASLLKGGSGSVTSGMAYDRASGLMYCQLSSLNNRVLYKIDPIAKKIVGQFGVDTNTGTGGTPARLPASSVSISVGNYAQSRNVTGSVYCQSGLSGASAAELDFIDCGSMRFIGNYTGITQARSCAVFGFQTGAQLKWFAVGHAANGTNSTASIQLYGVTMNVVQANLGSQLFGSTGLASGSYQLSGAAIGAAITVANIDATWTNIVNVWGPMYDPTDGHIIVAISTNDAVTNKRYWVKINTTTGAIVWKTAAGGQLALGMDAMMHLQRLPASVFIYVDSSDVIKSLNLVTGVNTTLTYNDGTGTVTAGSLGNYVPELGMTVDDRNYTVGNTPVTYLGNSQYFGGGFTNYVAGLVVNGPANSISSFLLRYSELGASFGTRQGWQADMPNKKLYITYVDGSFKASYMAVNNIETGVITAQQSYNTMFAGFPNALAQQSWQGPWFGADGSIIMCTSTSNHSIIYKIDPTTLLCVGSFGIDNSGFGNGLTTFEHIDYATGIKVAGTNYIVGHCSLSSAVVVLNTDTMSAVNWYDSATLGGFTILCQAGANKFFVAGRTGTVVTLSGGPIAGNPAPLPTIGTFNVTTLDAAIVGIAELAMFYDPTDGNPVFFIAPSFAIGTYWWFKLSKVDASVIWTMQELAETNNPLSSQIWDQQISAGGLLAWRQLTVSTAIAQLNTQAGTKQVLTYASGLTTFNGVYYSRNPAMIGTIAQMSWGYGSGTKPDYLNTANDSFSGIAMYGFYRAGSGAVCPWPPVDQYYPPVSVGVRYTSTAKLLPPDQGADAGTQNGPAFGKLRRLHWYGLKLVQSGPLTIAADDQTARNVDLQTPGGVATTVPNLFSGTVSTTLECDDSFNGQITWSAYLAYPVTVATVGGYIQSTDK